MLKSEHEVGRHVEYYPEWRTQLRFFVDEKTWPKVRQSVEALKAREPTLTWSFLGHTTEDRDGVRFGSEDKDAERRVAVLLGFAPETTTVVFKETRGRPSKYPLDDLKKIGDHFLVQDKSKALSLSATCRYHESLYPDRMYRVAKVREGVLVILVQHETADYDRRM